MTGINENSNKRNSLNSPIYGIEFEYQMPRNLAKCLLGGDNKKIADPQKYLVDYVNRELGLRGHCRRVVVV